MDLSIFLSMDFMFVVVIIIGITKSIRNVVNVKGSRALGINFLVAVVYALMQFSETNGFIYATLIGLVAGAISAGLFTLTKLVGKQVNPEGTK